MLTTIKQVSLLFAVFIVLINGQYECHEAYSCDLQSITSSSNIECYGYNACNSASLMTDADVITYCYGSYGCYRASINSQNILYCDGLFSCADSSLLKTRGSNIYCRGESACIGSYLNASNSIICNGHRGCKDGTLYFAGLAYLRGWKSAENAILYNKDSSVTLYFYGAFASDNTTVICENNATCSIFCIANNCNNLTILCGKDGLGNCDATPNCYDHGTDGSSVLSDNCPNGYIPEYPIVDINGLSDFTTQANSYNPCYTIQTNAKLCDGSESCLGKTLDTSNISAPVCCEAFRTCRYAKNITSRVDLNDSLLAQVSLRCDGTQSCRDVNTTATLLNGGDMYVSGVNGFYQSVSGYKQTAILDSISNLYCTAYLGCRSSLFKNGNILFSTGRQAFSFSSIENFNTLYCYARDACQFSDFKNIGSMHCIGWYACNSADIDDINEIFGHGYAILETSTIINVKSLIYVHGYYGLGNSTISTANNANDTRLFCHGLECCIECNVTGFTNIDISGNYSFLNASVVNVEGEMKVFGYQSFFSGAIDNSGSDVDNSNFEVSESCTRGR